MNKPIWQWSAAGLADALASGKLTAEEAVGACVARMRETNGSLNAVVDDLGAEAMTRARELDAMARSGKSAGPLHGIPVTIKENIDQKGRATPNGVRALAGNIAPDDSPFVRNLIQAGAVVIGRTNTPEFSFRATTVNELHGPTRNPWNDWASPGGSSGGASAAVMSGMGPIAHGNDIGGSLRFPSAQTGAVTVKPGLGRTPAWNPSQAAERGLLAQLMSVQGVICREVADLRLAMRSAVAYDPHDPWQVPVPFDMKEIDTSTKGKPRVAFTRNTYQYEAHPSVIEALEKARECLLKEGYEVVDAEPPDMREIGETGYRALMGEVCALMLPDIRKHGSGEINRIFDDYFDLFPPYTGEDLLREMARRSHFVRQWNLFLQDYPLVLTPFRPYPPFALNRDAEGRDGVMEVLGCGLWSFGINYLGLPAGIISPVMGEEMPIAIQIAGKRFREDMIIDAMQSIEAQCGIMAQHLFERI